MSAAPLLQLSALTVPGSRCGPLDLALRPGLSLVSGGEGCGKSRLLRLLAEAAAAQGLSHCLPQPLDPAQDETLARDWLAAQQSAHGPHWRAPLAAELVQALALDEHLDKRLFMLSAGSRRKLGLVAAAASDARLTLLDQPYAALDARSARLLSELLAEAAQDPRRAWVLADYALPAALQDLTLAARISLGGEDE